MFRKSYFICLSLLFIASGVRSENPEVIKCPKAAAAFTSGDYALSYKEATRKACPKLKTLARWQQLLKNQSLSTAPLSLKDYQSFLDKNPNFPNKHDMRVAAERVISSETPWADLKKWFKNKNPFSNKILVSYYFSPDRPPLTEKDLKTLRCFWSSRTLSHDIEKKLIDIFESKDDSLDFLERAHHLIKVQPKRAGAFLKTYGNKLAQEELALLRVLLAFSLKHKDALGQAAELSKTHQENADLVMARFKRLVHDESSAVLEFLREHQKVFQRNRAQIVRLIYVAARDAMTRKAYQVAFDILDTLSFKRKLHLIEINFLKGLLLLEFLKRPEGAVPLFESVSKMSSQPGTLSQGYYWLARAQGVLGAQDKRKASLKKATLYRQTYYGQLAMDQLGQPYKTKMMDVKRDQGVLETIYALPEASYALLLRSLGRLDLVPPFLYKIFYKRSAQKGTRAFLNALVFFSYDFFPGYVYDMARLWGVTYRHPLTYGVRPEVSGYKNAAFLSAIIRKESGLNELAISSAGARGLMQLMEGTALKVARELSIDLPAQDIKNLLLEDPALNVRLGARYIENKLEQFDGSKELMLAGYNAGPLNAQKWIERYGDFRKGDLDQLLWIELIPYYETRDYVKRVMANYRVYRFLEKASSSRNQKKLEKGDFASCQMMRGDL